jgi:TrwC relaxase
MGTGLGGILRMTWMQDGLEHVLEHCETDEPSGTWTGLACPDHQLALGSDVDNAALARLCTQGEIADIIWEAPEDFTTEHRHVFEAALDAHYAGNSKTAGLMWDELQTIWSRAWSANYAALQLLQDAGLARFSPVKPQRWVIASFEHHCSHHGLLHPHIHNIIITRLTAGVRVG